MEKRVQDNYQYPKLSDIPTRNGNPKKALFFRTDEDVADWLNTQAKTRGMKTSAFLRTVMEEFVEANHERDK